MQADHGTISSHASFGEIAKSFVHNRHDHLHVVDDGFFKGAVALQDIRAYLDQPELEKLVIAHDVMHDDHPCLRADMPMVDALHFFSAAQSERLPVTDENSRFLGVIGKTDLILFLAGKPRDVV